MVHVPIRTRKALQGHSTTPDFTRIAGFPPRRPFYKGRPFFIRDAADLSTPSSIYGAGQIILRADNLFVNPASTRIGPRHGAQLFFEGRSDAPGKALVFRVRKQLFGAAPRLEYAASEFPIGEIPHALDSH